MAVEEPLIGDGDVNGKGTGGNDEIVVENTDGNGSGARPPPRSPSGKGSGEKGAEITSLDDFDLEMLEILNMDVTTDNDRHLTEGNSLIEFKKIRSTSADLYQFILYGTENVNIVNLLNSSTF